jgi:hypothetical protein
MNVKDSFMSFGSFRVKDRSQTHFWMDTWLGNQSLKDKFPSLFNIVRRKQDSMATVLASVPLNISFRSNLVGRNLRDWHRIVASLQNMNLYGKRMRLFGDYIHLVPFFVKSMYAALINNGSGCHKIYGWSKFLQE